jgi:hypothetical protein
VEGKEPAEVTLEVAVAAMEARRRQDQEKAQNRGGQGGQTLRNPHGRYGLYVTDGKPTPPAPRRDAEQAKTWTAGQCNGNIAPTWPEIRPATSSRSQLNVECRRRNVE